MGLFQKQVNAAIREPHHYATALLLTVAAFCFGEVQFGTIAMVWLYALGENVTSDQELQEILKQCMARLERVLTRGGKGK